MGCKLGAPFVLLKCLSVVGYRGCPIIRRNSGSKYDQILTPRVIIRRLGFF